ncbi:reverse transcriptase domain-containing protein [Tanacetum coccineum]
MANKTLIVTTVTKSIAKEKTPKDADVTPRVNIHNFCKEHYEDILLVIMDKLRREKRKDVHARLDFGEIPKKRRIREGSQNSSARTLSTRYRNPSERPKAQDRLRYNDRHKRSSSEQGCSRGVEESYDLTRSSYETGTEHEYRSHDRNRSRYVKRGRESKSPLSRISESDTSDGGHWKSKLKRHRGSRGSRAVRVWFDELPPESIDGYKDLKAAFLAYFMQQKKYVKDPVEIHNIKQRDGETIEEFMERFKVETRRMKGAPECMQISGFMHGVNNPELTKCLNEHVPKTMEEMMIATTAFIRGEVVAAGKKKGHASWRAQEQSKRHASEQRSDFRGQPEEGRGLLKKQIEELVQAGKLSHLIKEIKQGRDQLKAGKKEVPTKDNSMEIYMIQPCHRVTRQKVTQSFERVNESTFPSLSTSSRTEGPLVIEAKIGGYIIHSMYVDGGSSMEVFYEHCFNRLLPEIKSQRVPATTSLIGFSGETIWSLGQLRLLVTIGDADHSTKAWMNFMIRDPICKRTHIIVLTPKVKLGYIRMEAVRYDRSTAISSRTSAQYPVRIFACLTEKRGQAPERAKAIQAERMCVDFTDLNKACPQDCYPLLEIDWKVESLYGYPFKFFLDAYKGYHQIQMVELDEEKTAFHTSQGVYCYTKMPFGLKNAGATYQRLIDKAFDSQVGRNIEVYVDDLVIKSHTEAEMLRDIDETFRSGTGLQAIKAAFVGATPASSTQTKGRTDCGLELNYTPMEKLVLSLVFAAKRLRRTLFTDGSSCIDGSGAGLILTSPERTEFTYALRFQFTASNNEAEYEALIVGLQIAAQMGMRSVHVSVDSKLVANQVLGTYVAKEENMVKYLEKAKSLISGFANFSISQVPRSKNKKADALSKIASTSFAYLSNQMTPIMEYLKDGTLLGDRKEASKLRIKARQYELLKGVLYKRSFLKPWLRCVGPLQADYVDARDMRRTCNDCQVHRPVPRNPSQSLTPITAPWPFYKWGIDIAGPFPEGPGKVKFLIVAMDYFTKWIETKAVATITSNQTNGLIERVNRSLGEGIKARLGEGNKNWIEELPYVLWAHRTMIKSSHGDTPFSLTYETKAVIPAEIGMPTDRTAVVDAIHNDEELQLNLDLLEERREHAAIREAKAKSKMTKYYNAMVYGVTFRPGDFVYRSNDASHAVDGGKLGPK